MPTGSRIRTDNVFGTVTDNPLTAGAVTLNSAGLVNLAAVASNHAVIVLDPLRTAGAPEIVIVTAHTAAASSATITRGAYGTTARSHAAGVLWIHAPTTEDTIRIVTSGTRPSDPYMGQMVFESDTKKFVGYGGTDWAQRDAGGQLGYAQVVANQATITAEVDITGLSVTVTVGTGRRVKITGSLYWTNTGTAGTDLTKIYEDGVQINERAIPANTAAHGVECVVVKTPTAGSRTYKVRGQATAGTGTSNASATFPAFIVVEDIGAA